MTVLTVRFHSPSLVDKDSMMSDQCTASSWTDVFADLDKANAEIARLKDLRQDQAQNYFSKWLASEGAFDQVQMENSSLKYENERMSGILKTCAEAAETSNRLMKLISEQRDEALAENEQLKKALQEKILDEMVAESQRLGLYDEFKIKPLPVDPALLEQLPNEDDFFCECPEPVKVVYSGNNEVRRTVYCKKCLFDLKDQS